MIARYADQTRPAPAALEKWALGRSLPWPLPPHIGSGDQAARTRDDPVHHAPNPSHPPYRCRDPRRGCGNRRETGAWRYAVSAVVIFDAAFQRAMHRAFVGNLQQARTLVDHPDRPASVITR